MKSLDELRLFDHLAESLHFGRTAAECHVTPSTLSRAIARLEHELGRTLFERDRRSVHLTADGVRLRAFARDVLAGWERLSSSWQVAADEVAGTLSIFCTVTASQSVLPEILHRYRSEFPNVQLRIETGYAAEALTALAAGRVDVSVAAVEERVPRDLVAHRVATTALVPVTSSTVAARLPAKVSPQWSRVPWVLPAEGLARTLVDQWFRRLRVRPLVAAEAVGHEAVLALVALGCGVGLVPKLVADKAPASADLRVVKVAPALPSFDIAVCTLPESFDRAPVAALWQSLTERVR
jgi:LysR family positive regulator for ilvC